MKKIAVIAIVLLMLPMILPMTRAGQITYLNFEGFSMASFNSGASTQSTSWTKIATFQLSLPSAKYLSGVTVDWSVASTAGMIKVEVNGVNSSATAWEPVGGYLTPFGFTGIYGTSFTITIYGQVSVDSNGNPGTITLNNVYAYTLSEDYTIKSKLTELKYIPPGADGTTTALILNQTEVLLDKNYTLSQGTVAFWLKWGGTQNITILAHGSSPVVGIKNGELFVNTGETTYSFPEPAPVGVYVPVYIGWSGTEGYILINNTKLNLNWQGNVTLDRVGSVSQKTGTLVDELKIWNTYIPPDQVIYASQQNQYTLIWNGKALTITPAGGDKLGVLNVYFLNSTLGQINSTSLSTGQPTWTVPNGTYEVVIEREQITRSYILNQLDSTAIAFPAEDTTLAALNVKVVSGNWKYLVVKTVDGKIATATELNGGTAGFSALMGKEYLFEFIDGNTTRVRAYTVTGSGSIAFYLPPLDANLTPPVDVDAYYQGGLITVSYLDSRNNTNFINVTLTGYKDFHKAWQLHDVERGSWGLFVMKTNSSADYVDVDINANVSGEMMTFHRTVYIGGNAGRAPFPEKLVPPALVFLVTALLGIFVFSEPSLMLLGGAGALGLMTLLGWIPAVPGVIAVLSMLGVLGLIMSRR